MRKNETLAKSLLYIINNKNSKLCSMDFPSLCLVTWSYSIKISLGVGGEGKIKDSILPNLQKQFLSFLPHILLSYDVENKHNW